MVRNDTHNMVANKKIKDTAAGFCHPAAVFWFVRSAYKPLQGSCFVH